MFAVKSGNSEVGNILVKRCGDITKRNMDGNTAMEIAVEEGHRDFSLSLYEKL